MHKQTLAHIIDADTELNNAQFIYGGLDYMIARLTDGQESDLVDAIQHALIDLSTSLFRINAATTAAYEAEKARAGLRAVA
ncbi:hypothetical protein [Chenggangzhangella methanolivorans]|uniref:Uncharacterized protein n=1 Tax=Chenggangzhangella methanolivorans TaxID=1437009 RepID=A0A9E6RD60_9HYPH|nr:hypothetical protein [Chenggangzhangella methanolivorans]QZO01650.1 hypothetical protein K6K41_09770 [Chenggangzhangella methanolivorans]